MPPVVIDLRGHRLLEPASLIIIIIFYFFIVVVVVVVVKKTNNSAVVSRTGYKVLSCIDIGPTPTVRYYCHVVV